jgi:hypothetical protein
MGSGGVLVRSTPVLTFSPGVREQPESPPRAPSRVQTVPIVPVLRPVRSNLPIIPGIRRRPSLDLGGIVGPVARLAATSGGRTVGKLLAIFVAVAALGIFAGLNMRSLTEDAEGQGVPAMAAAAQAAQASGRASDAPASERVQARGTLAPRKEAAPRR